MSVKKVVARSILKVMPWKAEVEPWPVKSIIVGAPHTSNFDAVAMVLVMWSNGRDFNFLVKDNVMKNPILARIVKALGGIAVNRRQSTNLISALSNQIEEKESLSLCITPKGTRSPKEYWKSGFYRIAYEHNLPISLGFLDSTTRTFGIGPTFYPTWDIKKDMDTIRAFYKDMKGVNPENTSVPRLRAEDDPEAAAYLLRPVDGSSNSTA